MTLIDKTAPSQTASISLEFDLKHPPEKVWRALTDPVLLAEWLLPVIDLKLESGAAFTFKTQAYPGWDGTVSCRFVEIEPLRKLSYTWSVPFLDTVVTFTLTPTPSGTRLVLGLRDVMDEPKLLEPEWRRKKVVPALRDLYDQIWVYGLPQICDPLEGISLPAKVRQKMIYTGYLHRELPAKKPVHKLPAITERPYLLVTTGGGGDGEQLIDWVLRAYEHDPLLPYPALLVLGPFMQPELQAQFIARAEKLKRVEAITFHNSMETLMAGAVGVVAMGGYNTFCEVLSLDKRALIVPRTAPRLEQHIRASRAARLGLISMLSEDATLDPQLMAAALRNLPRQSLPSEVIVPGLLEGLSNVGRLVAPWIEEAPEEAQLNVHSIAK